MLKIDTALRGALQNLELTQWVSAELCLVLISPAVPKLQQFGVIPLSTGLIPAVQNRWIVVSAEGTETHAEKQRKARLFVPLRNIQLFDVTDVDIISGNWTL